MKELTVIFGCTWKFALTFPVAIYGMKFSIFKTLLFTNIGGIIGVIFFTFLSDGLIKVWNKHIKHRIRAGKSNKPVFTKKRRNLIRIKSKYGLPGIVILNPILLSIPVSSFLVVKYYGRKLQYVLWLCIGQFTWSIVYTFVYFFIYQNYILQ